MGVVAQTDSNDMFLRHAIRCDVGVFEITFVGLYCLERGINISN